MTQSKKQDDQQQDLANNKGRQKKKKSSSSGSSVPYYKLFSFADSTDVVLMLIGSIASVANGMTLPIMTLLFGNLINAFGQNANNRDTLRRVSKVALEFVYMAIGSGVASFFQVSCWMVTGERQAGRMRSVYLKTILRQDVAFFDKETKTGEVIGRISGDTVLIQDAMGEKVGKFIQLFTTFIGGFVIAFTQGWLLTLVMLSCIPPLVISGALMSAIVSKMASHGQTAYSQAGIIVEQTIGSIRTVVSFTGEKHAISQYDKSLNETYKSGVNEGLASGLGFGSVLLVMFSTYALAIWFGGKMIIENGYTGGDVISVIFSVLTGSMSLGQASPCLSAFGAGRAASFKMFETINRKPEIDSDDSNGLVLDDIRGDIELKDVSFSYPARPDEQIFNGFSLFIPSGTTLALVGHSGSGKSTVISLIERFYDPQAGEVLIDGINLKKFQLRWIREKIALVSQEPVLFSSSIKENIVYGKNGATDDEIKAAALLANASKFIDKLPQGLDSMVGEHGTQLSGGQKQRIAIARAILKDPRILLLDEATSALDAESEHIVQEALDRIMINKTTVIVAHRLSTVKNANMIAVVHQGHIVEKGSHLELLKVPDGAYSQLIRLQEVHRLDEDVAESLVFDRISSQNQSFERSRSQPNSFGRSRTQRQSFGRSASEQESFQRSISQGSVGVGDSSPQPFSVSFGLPALHIQENVATTLEPTPLVPIGQTQEVPFRRLAYLNKPEIPVLLLGALASAVNGVMFPLFGIIFPGVLKSFYEPEDELRKDVKFWAFVFVIFGFVLLIVEPASKYFFSVAGSRLIQRIRSMCFQKVVHMEIDWYDEPENSSGSIGARLSADAALVRSLVGDSLALVVQNTASVVGGLAIAFAANWTLALIILALIPLIGLNGYVQMKFMEGFSADAKIMYEEASQVANDAVGSIRTVASFGAEEKVLQLYQKKCEGPTKTGIRQGLISGIGFGISFFLLYCVNATCFYAGARLVDDGKTTFSKVFQLSKSILQKTKNCLTERRAYNVHYPFKDILYTEQSFLTRLSLNLLFVLASQVFFALTMAATGISQSSSLAPDSSKAKIAAASIFRILDQKSKIDSSDDSGMIMENVKGEIELQHISFKYSTRPDIQIFRDLCLAIHSGKTVALVGESGSGKSTVISLLLRFYDPDSGQVTLDGMDIRKLQLRWLRQQIGLVSQEPALFNDTVRANIAYGKEGDASEAEILAAAEQANAHKFISGLQKGYDTMVGERGIQLSGGQKQRVAIARAMVKAPKILLLDEATSALDAESERVVQDALDKVMVNRTTVVVAHRFATIQNADVIAVVKNGIIAEKGKHDSLIKIKNGVYASLVALHMSASS